MTPEEFKINKAAYDRKWYAANKKRVLAKRKLYRKTETYRLSQKRGRDRRKALTQPLSPSL